MVAIGPAALSLVSGIPLPPGSTVRWFARRCDQAEIDPVITKHCPDQPVRIDWLDLPIGAERAQWRLAYGGELAEMPISAWAIAIDTFGEVDDPGGAMADIDARRLRLNVKPRTFIRDSADNLLQIAVWCAWTGLVPSPEVYRITHRHSNHVLGLERERWRERFAELLCGWRPSEGLRFLAEVRALQLMLPEVCAMIGFHESCSVHHKDIWEHTLQVVDKCPTKLAVRWSALVHDCGKVWTRTVTAGGKVHFFRHEELGASLMEGIAARFHLAADLRDRVVYVVANHARANVYSTDWTDRAVRRLIRDMGPHLGDVIAFSQSDYTTKRTWRIKEVQALAADLKARIGLVIEQDSKVAPLPKGFGSLVMEQTGRAGGPWLGSMIAWLESEIEDGRLEGGAEASHYYAYVQSHRPELLTADGPTRRTA